MQVDRSVQAYSDELRVLGIDHNIVEHPELKTPPEVQNYLGLTLADGLSTMIMKAGDEYIAIVRRDDCRLDFKKLKQLVNKNIRMASPEEFVKVTGMPLGAARVHNPKLTTYLDGRLLGKDYLTGGTGSFTCSFRYKSGDLRKIPNSKVVDVSQNE